MAHKPIGPGPGAYKLPTLFGFDRHDGTKYRNPQYSFGLWTEQKCPRKSPGPYKFNGLSHGPAWSLGARFPSRRLDRVPGPGAHRPEACPPNKDRRAPAYSLGARCIFKLRGQVPASNAYAIRFGPGGPSYSITGRPADRRITKSPGPGYFQKDYYVVQTRPPCYSLGAKLTGNCKPTVTPGPARYPPKLYDTKKNSYSYSFGIPHSPWAPPMIVNEDTMDCL